MQNELRDRLVSLINQDNCPSPYMCSDKCKYSHLEQCIGDRLADRILADGWIRPPCKVGTEVFYITDYSWRILSEKINKVSSHTISIDTIFIFETDMLTFGLSDIGKTIFLTKDQAEQKLKELRENG